MLLLVKDFALFLLLPFSMEVLLLFKPKPLVILMQRQLASPQSFLQEQLVFLQLFGQDFGALLQRELRVSFLRKRQRQQVLFRQIIEQELVLIPQVFQQGQLVSAPLFGLEQLDYLLFSVPQRLVMLQVSK